MDCRAPLERGPRARPLQCSGEQQWWLEWEDGGRDGKKWMGLGYILEAETTELLVAGMDVEGEGKTEMICDSYDM